MSENLKADQIDRLWEYRNKIDEEFYSRLNFFLIFESVLLSVVGFLHSTSGVPSFALKGIVLLGFLITSVWWYIQARLKYVLDFLNTLCRENIPEYNLFIPPRGKWPFLTMPLLTHLIPALIALIWLIFLFL